MTAGISKMTNRTSYPIGFAAGFSFHHIFHAAGNWMPLSERLATRGK
jgi:hypothetical protein